ncbi:hypothetical protein BR93DRAFT_966659 [Coniochaeta sp. PMI_546]|nr:hypothetical protein BR93DRAFT_966659 [Coniochaeta sp. PMI_546]
MPFPESPIASSADIPDDPKLLVFDPNSDLTFEVGDKTHNVSCQVDAKSVARASHVFRRMLFGGFAESKPSEGEWIVSLPEDDINVMAIIFNIIHGHVHKVPKILPKNMAELVGPSSHCYHDDAVETDMLYLVTMTADKYDIIHLLRPWVKYWLERVRCKKRWSQKGWDDNWCAELLWAAWILGDHDLLHSQLNKVVLSAKMAGSSPSGSKSAREVIGLCVVDSFGNEIMMSQDVSGPSRILEILDVWGMSHEP